MSLLLQLVSATSVGARIVMIVFDCSYWTVVHELHIWTLLIGPFYRPFSSGFAFLMVLFEIFMAMQYFPSRERQMGSTTFLAWMLIVNLFVDVLYVMAMFLMSYSSVMHMVMPISGLWPMIMVCLTLRCMSDPSGSTSFWGLVMIPNKFYPLALAAFFCLLSGMRALWDIFAAVAVGYAYPYLPIERMLPSRTCVSRLEQRLCSGSRGCLGGQWECCAAGAEYDATDRRYATLRDFGRPQTTSQQPQSAAQGGGGGGSQFTAFSGSGNRLGDGGEETVQLARVQEAEQTDSRHTTSPPGAASAGGDSGGSGAPGPTNADSAEKVGAPSA